MTLERSHDYLLSLLRELVSLPSETEWVEFKHNNDDPKQIGEYISGLANSAALLGKQSAYLVWGIEDEQHEVVGTTFNPSSARHKQQELESWLLQKTAPKIDFHFYEFDSAQALPVVILEIQAASHTPVQFDGIEYIRVGSYKKRLREFAEKERALWRVFDQVSFERQLAAENVPAEQVLKLLAYPAYFDQLDLPLPEGRNGILQALQSDHLIQLSDSGQWHITNLGAVLFAKKLEDFRHLARKAVRLILYRGNSRVETIRELSSNRGYAVGYEELIEHLKTWLPSNEVIGQAFRQELPMYPEVALRELVANAMIHQDFSLTGTGTMIELFDTRLEITNPGTPLVDTARFIDSPPKSRNEVLASFLRRINICEERGSGIDKVVTQTELFQLPAPLFETFEYHTKVTLFAHRAFKDMDREERIRACYQHAVLKYLNREVMNNSTLRERFGIAEHNKSAVSVVLKEAVQAGVIKLYDPSVGARGRRYVPYWTD